MTKEIMSHAICSDNKKRKVESVGIEVSLIEYEQALLLDEYITVGPLTLCDSELMTGVALMKGEFAYMIGANFHTGRLER